MRRNRRAAQAGVTLIEMLVVVTIIALFAALVAPNIFGNLAKGKNAAALSQIESYITALSRYKADTSQFPTNEQGLKALWEKPEGVEGWEGPYLNKEIGNDPWGHPYVYHYPAPMGDMPELITYGADGQPGGEGENSDLVSWKNNNKKKQQ